jgi:hypothetical protein
MKPKFIVPLAVALLLVGMAWHQAGRLSKARERRQEVAREASSHGVMPDAAAPGEVRLTKTVREEKPATTAEKLSRAGMSAAEVVAFMAEEEALRIKKNPKTPEREEKLATALEQVKQMPPAELRKLLAGLKACPDLIDQAKAGWTMLIMRSLIADRPADAVELYLDLPKNDRDIDMPPTRDFFFFPEALASWTTKDPGSALAWVRQHMGERPDLVNSAARTALIHVIAKQDRRQAFRLISELDVDSPSYVPQGIVASAKTPEERMDAIAALREFLPTVKGKSDRNRAGDYAIAALGRSMMKEGFESASKWAEGAGLTPAELSSFGSDIGTSVPPGEAKRWTEWFGSQLPGPACARPVRQIMMYWAEKDYVEAGNWLAAAPAGDMKNSATAMYAEAIAGKAPEAAAQWAETLPTGKLRTQTLARVYCDWPKKDESARAAAEEFAVRNGLVKSATDP